jgi:hypothetical protein
MLWHGGTVQKRVYKQLSTFFIEKERSFHFSLTGRKPSVSARDDMKRDACRLEFESFNQLLDVQEKHAKAFRRIVSDERYEPFEVRLKAGLLFLLGSAQLVQALVAARLAERVALEPANGDKGVEWNGKV